MRMRRSQPSLSAMPLFRPGATLLAVIQHVKAGMGRSTATSVL
jgi:hypothetical protein